MGDAASWGVFFHMGFEYGDFFKKKLVAERKEQQRLGDRSASKEEAIIHVM